MTHRRRIALGASATCAALGALAASCHAGDHHTAPRGEATRTAVVHPGELTARVLLTGALHPTRALDVVVPQNDAFAAVIRWMPPDGASVKAGDRLFELDAGPVASKLADARRQLTAARAQLRVMQRNQAVDLASKRLAVRDAEITRDKARLRDALPADLVPRRDAEQASLRLRQAEAALRAAQADLTTTAQQHALDLELKQIEVDKTQRASRATAEAIDALVVRAPRDGMVLINQQASGDGHKFRVGDSVQSGLALVSLPDLTRPMEVRASLSDVDDGLISLHMTGRCTLDAYPAQPIPCSVEQLAPVARPSPGRDPLRRSFEVTLALGGGGPAQLRPGMSVEVALDRPAIRGLVVPRTAVIPGAPAHVRLGSGEPREVALAGCDAQRCAIASGLADGDVIAEGGAS
ncbi:MAG TPA: HlyD family efflux transporter periplasmic adaptor subunit [Kofleriaceae bacterium]|nr:HlyD family efflux transporter periplasmic adaptor subunit [Kofleriaceae bacterium]